MKNNSKTAQPPKVTIAVPYYDSPIYLLRKCLDSCLTQTYRNLEILVLVDGTPKDLTAIYRDYAKHSQIRFRVSDRNLGVSTQRNLAIKEAAGKYIAFVDSDDCIDEAMIERMLDAYRADRECDLVIAGIKSGNNEVCEDGYFDRNVFFAFPSRFCFIQYTNFCTNKLFRLDLIRRHNLAFHPKVKLGEDAIFCQEYCQHIRYIRCLSDQLYHYTQRPSSATKQYMPDYYKYERRVIQKIQSNFCPAHLCSTEYKFLQHWRFIKILSVYQYYFGYFRAGAISKTQLLEIFQEIQEVPVLQLNPEETKANPYFSRAEQVIIKALQSSPQRLLMAISKTYGKTAFISTLRP